MTEFESGQNTAVIAMLKLVVAVLTPEQRRFVASEMDAEHQARSRDWHEMEEAHREHANGFLHFMTNAFAEIDDQAVLYSQKFKR